MPATNYKHEAFKKKKKHCLKNLRRLQLTQQYKYTVHNLHTTTQVVTGTLVLFPRGLYLLSYVMSKKNEKCIS